MAGNVHEGSAVLRAQGGEVLSLTATATAKSRANLAIHHLFAACRFAARVTQVEQENQGQPLGSFYDEILQHSLGVATSTVAAVEGYANELYFENSVLRSNVNAVATELLAELMDKGGILNKYAMALAVHAGKRLDPGGKPVQNMDALIGLRNGVVHFRPEWFEEQDRHDKVSKRLKHRFDPSPYFPNEPIFPRAWASASFVAWALNSVVAFLDHFYAEAGMESPIAPFRAQLATLSGGLIKH